LDILKNIIDKFFLVKEIRSQKGELHFLRWRLLQIPWFRVYIHKICLPDYDSDKHTHPWNFLSLILRGGYTQELSHKRYVTVKQFDVVQMSRHEGHRITLNESPTWTLVIAYGKYIDWGYLTTTGFMHHKKYRTLKNEGNLSL
jgi:hypothetical protein